MLISHNKPNLKNFDFENLQRVINSGMIAYGKQAELFEDEICNFLDLSKGHCVLTSSGSAALYISLLCLNVKNKTVAIPSYVCSSLRNAVALAGGIEVIIDIEQDYPNIDIDKLNMIKPDFAIIPHMFGIPVDLDRIDKSITVVEDCAQSFGAKYKNKYTGTVKKVGILSFYATKLLTTGEGGAIISNDKNLIDKVRDYIDFDCRHDKNPRFNFHMSDINAAIGRQQLKNYNSFIEKREKIFKMYKIMGLNFVEPNFKDCQAIRYRAVLNTDKVSYFKEKLAEHDIKTIIPIEEYELLKKTKNAVRFSRNTLSLPCYPALEDNELEYINNTLRNIL